MNTNVKNELHRLIDEIEDEEALNFLKEDAAVYAGKKEISDALTRDQIKELQEALDEVENGETLSYEEFINHTNEWIKKLS